MADLGTGTTIVFGTSSFAAQLTNAQPVSGGVRAPHQTSHMGTTVAHTFIASKLIDWGELAIDFWFDPDNEPPLDAAAETITITCPIPSGQSNGATLVGTGFLIGYDNVIPLEELMTASAVIKWSGDLAWTDSS